MNEGLFYLDEVTCLCEGLTAVLFTINSSDSLSKCRISTVTMLVDQYGYKIIIENVVNVCVYTM